MKERYQPCPFCGEPLPGDWHKVVKQTRTGWVFHEHCDRAIARLKRSPHNHRISYDRFRRKLAYINLNRDETNGNMIVFQ